MDFNVPSTAQGHFRTSHTVTVRLHQGHFRTSHTVTVLLHQVTSGQATQSQFFYTRVTSGQATQSQFVYTRVTSGQVTQSQFVYTRVVFWILLLAWTSVFNCVMRPSLCSSLSPYPHVQSDHTPDRPAEKSAVSLFLYATRAMNCCQLGLLA